MYNYTKMLDQDYYDEIKNLKSQIDDLKLLIINNQTEILMRLESNLIRRSDNKQVSNIEKKVNRTSNNKKRTLDIRQWWKLMYINNDPIISKFYTDADIKKIIDTDTKLKTKKNETDRKKHIALNIYTKVLSDNNKKEIQLLHRQWKIKQEELNTKRVTVDK